MGSRIGRGIATIFKRFKNGLPPFFTDLGVSWWKGGSIEVDGLTYLKDSSVNELHCLAEDSVLYLNGTNNYNLVDTTYQPHLNSYSLCVKVKTNIATLTSFWGRDYLYAGQRYSIFHSSTSIGKARCIVDYGGGDVLLTGTSSINDGEWHTIILSHNKITGELILYVDGINEDSETNINLIGLDSNSLAPLDSGVYNNAIGSPANFGEIWIAHRAIVEKAMTAGEAAQYHIDQSLPIAAAIEFKDNECGGDVSYDVSGNERHGKTFGDKDGSIPDTYYSLSQYSSFHNWKNGFDLWQKLLSTTYTVDGGSSIVSGVTAIKGLAYYAGFYYVLDLDSATRYLRKLTGSLISPTTTLSVDITAEVPVLRDITTDGTYLYLSTASAVVYRYTLDLVFVDTITLATTDGIGYYNGHLFMCDGISTNIIRKYTVDGVFVKQYDYNGLATLGTDSSIWEMNGRIFLMQYEEILEFDEDLNYVGVSANETSPIFAGSGVFDGNSTYISAYNTGNVDTLSSTVSTSLSYLAVPLQSDKTSIKTSGDTISGYTWISKNLAGQWINNPLTTFYAPVDSRIQAADAIILADTGSRFFYEDDGVTPKGFTYDDLQANLSNILFWDVSTANKYKNGILYSRGLTHDEWREVEDWVNNPNPEPLIYVTDDDGNIVTSEDGKLLRIDVTYAADENGEFITDDNGDYVII